MKAKALEDVVGNWSPGLNWHW